MWKILLIITIVIAVAAILFKVYVEVESLVKGRKAERKRKDQVLPPSLSKRADDVELYYKRLLENVDAAFRAQYEAKIETLKALEAKYEGRVKENDKALKELEYQYDVLMDDVNEAFEEWYKDIAGKKEKVEGELDGLRELYEAALAARNKERDENRKGVVTLGERELRELRELYGVCRGLLNPVPLYKALYEMFFKDEVKRVVEEEGVAGVCGIYKITNVVDGKVYVGQSVNVGERWKQHCKRGSGAEVGTLVGGKLYGAMMEEGLWNFRFELLQRCEREKLNELESYWIRFYRCNEVGYNSKGGKVE